MNKKADLTGKKFGRLLAIEKITKTDKNRNLFWMCECACGNVTKVRASSLRNGSVKSCGCARYEDLKGKTFSRLTVISESKDRTESGEKIWECQCSCGNKQLVSTGNLKSGNTISCGCARKERAKESGSKNIKKAKAHTKEHALKEGTNLNLISEKKLRKDNTSGVTGVKRYKDKWQADINFKGKRHYLGRFKNKQDAINARKEAEEKYFKPMLEKYVVKE